MRSKQDYILSDKNGKMGPEKMDLKAVPCDNVDYEFTAVLDIAMDHKATTSSPNGAHCRSFQVHDNPCSGQAILKWCNLTQSAQSNSYTQNLHSHASSLIPNLQQGLIFPCGGGNHCRGASSNSDCIAGDHTAYPSLYWGQHQVCQHGPSEERLCSPVFSVRITRFPSLIRSLLNGIGSCSPYVFPGGHRHARHCCLTYNQGLDSFALFDIPVFHFFWVRKEDCP